ncbi:MAG: carbamoyltransferase C-terminal domain-containing protein [Hyphomicrobiaceae bacterium]
MKILAVTSGYHDAAAAALDDYDLKAAVQLERLTRRKGDGNRIPYEAIDEVLSLAGWAREEVDVLCLARLRFPYFLISSISPLRRVKYVLRSRPGRPRQRTLESEAIRQGEIDTLKIFDAKAALGHLGLRPDTRVFFYNHHDAHALSALFHHPVDNVLAYTGDGRGDNLYYSFHHLQDGTLRTLYGGDKELLAPTPIDSLGQAYAFMTGALDFRPNRHEGKLTGLAGYGKPVALDAIKRHFRVAPDGRIHSDFDSYAAMRAAIVEVAKTNSREDAAATIQQVLEDLVSQSVRTLLARTGARHLALAGGIFANVRLNRLLCEGTGVDSIFIFPGMGDEGIPVGGAYQFLLQRDGIAHWLSRRRRIDTMYLGRDYGASVDAVHRAAPGIQVIEGDPADVAARLCAAGYCGAIFTQRMEFGPRALGARSIIASPTDARINDSLNERLQRSEFMPFAPVVLEEDARRVFGIDDRNAYACRFMTITTDVKEEWRTRIPAVVHVDGTARPQIVTEADNPLYARTLRRFRDVTGLPAMVNTSFNAHEEPIIDTPEQCLRALQDDRVDFVVTDGGVYTFKPIVPVAG